MIANNIVIPIDHRISQFPAKIFLLVLGSNQHRASQLDHRQTMRQLGELSFKWDVYTKALLMF